MYTSCGGHASLAPIRANIIATRLVLTCMVNIGSTQLSFMSHTHVIL